MGENGHHCIQERKLGIMESSIQRMEKELFNGDGGLVKNVPVLNRNVEMLTKSVDDLRTVISGFSKFTNEYEGGKNKEDEIQKTSFRSWQYISIIIGSIVGLISILGFVLALKVNSSSNKEFNRVDTELSWKKDREVSPVTRGGHSGTTMDTTTYKELW